MPDQDIQDAVRGLRDHGDAGLVVALGWEHTAQAHPDEMMTQYDVQVFLWGMLPAWLRDPGDVPITDWRPVAEAAADFFTTLGQPRYAQLCRSDRTEQILEASVVDDARYRELFVEAVRDSGVVPPHGLRIEWLDENVRGPIEATLHTTITRVLEQAIVNGELDPADENARIQVASTAMELVPDDHTDTIHDMFLAERVERVGKKSRSATVSELLVRVRPYITKQLDLTPEALLEGVRHVGQLLNKLDTEGMDKEDTSAGYLRPVLVRFGLAEVVDGRVRATEKGTRVLDHPVLVFDAVCTGFMDAYERMQNHVITPLFAMLMLTDTVDFEVISERIAVVLHEMGWADEDGEPAEEEYVDDVILDILSDMEYLRVISDDEVREVTPYGRLVMHSVLVWRLKRGEIVVS